MADDYTTLNAGVGGDTMDEEAVTYGAAPTSRKRARVEVAGSAQAEIARVVNTTPAGTEYALVTRPIVSGTQTVTGPLTDTQLRATAVPVSGTVTASGPLTDTQLRATPVPVSGTVTASGPLTDTQLRATPVPVSGTVTADTELPAAAALADTTTNPTTPVVGALGEVFNGTTWDRIRAGTATGSLLVNNPTAANLLTTVSQSTAANLLTTATQGPANTATNAWPHKLVDNGGVNVATIKAASTAVAATDLPLAVGLHPTSPLPTGSNTIGALTANQSVNLAQIASTATSTGSRVTDAGVLSTFQAAPTAANILVGHVAQTATTAAATVITVPINRTWVGTITVTCDVANAAAAVAVGQALGTITTTGTSATPAAGTVVTCEARCGANVSAGTVGSQGANSITVPMVVSAGASALATIALASTQAGTNSRVVAICSGYLI